jgi:hypothetical protein
VTRRPTPEAVSRTILIMDRDDSMPWDGSV